MHVGIIRYKSKIIYIDLKDNEIQGYYYHNKKRHNISLKTIAVLLNSFFDKRKEEFLKQDGQYKIYLNKDTGYKHFYRDGKEDILKFLTTNGQSAIMYNDAKKKKKDSESKSFIDKKLGLQIVMQLAFYAVIISTNPIEKISSLLDNQTTYKIDEYSSINDKEVAKELEELKSLINVPDEQFYDFESICNAIRLASTLSSEDKTLLYNEELFKQIANTPMTEDRIMSLEEKLTNIQILTYTEEDLEKNKNRIEQGLNPTVGYYRPLNPNMIYLEKIDDYDSKSHEFIHLLQDNNYFFYIREASAEIISNEYYGSSIDSYQEEVKRVKVLMEIIGSNPIWNVNFSGSEEKLQEFTDILYNNLSFDEYDKIIDILTTSPGYKTTEGMKVINEEFDRILATLYNNIYHESIENNEVIQYIYNYTNVSDDTRHYFQDRENKEERITEIIEEFPLTETLLQDKNIEIDFYKEQRIEITEEEYLKSKKEGKEVYFDYNKEPPEGISIEPPDAENRYYLINNEKKVNSIEELIQLGYLFPEKFYRIEKEPVSADEYYEQTQKGESISFDPIHFPSGYRISCIGINQEKGIASITVLKEVNWEPVKETINDTKSQIIFPTSK